MKLYSLLKLTILANVIAVNFITVPSAKAGTFDEKEMAQDQIIAIAAPYRSGHHLVVIEQISGKDKCWAEQGGSPVIIDPLLMNFDFTGHCYRAADSNGYSIRIGGEEQGSDYLLKIVEQGNELVLIAVQRDPNKAPIVIGRTYAKSNAVTKIFLEPGWRFTKRSYQGKELGHFYFSQASTVASTIQNTEIQAIK
jgi:N-acetylmuramoyl-L-alanine amidase